MDPNMNFRMTASSNSSVSTYVRMYERTKKYIYIFINTRKVCVVKKKKINTNQRTEPTTNTQRTYDNNDVRCIERMNTNVETSSKQQYPLQQIMYTQRRR